MSQKLTSNSHTPSLPPPPPPPPQRMSVSEASDDGINEYALGHMPMPDFEALALDIQNRVSSRVGTVTMEIWNFREFFGMSVLVVKKLGVAREGLPPPRGWPPKAPALGP